MKIVIVPILVTLPRIVTVVSDEHPIKAFSPIVVTLVGIVTLVSDVHPWKAYSLILVNVSGITSTGDDGQPKNGPYVVTDDGITVLLALSNVPAKALFWILVTLVGIVIVARDEHPEKAP